MPTSTNVTNLKINELTEAQYDAAVQGGVIGANELSVLTDVEYVEPSDLATVATTGDYSDLINRPTNLVSTNTAQTISGPKTFSGDITLSGTTSIKNNTGGTNYTMLYRDASTIHVGASTSTLKLEGSGTRPAYNNDSLALLSDVTGGLPSQTGNAGKFLTTDGTDASWAAVGALPDQMGNGGKFLTTDGLATASWSDNLYVQGGQVVIRPSGANLGLQLQNSAGFYRSNIYLGVGGVFVFDNKIYVNGCIVGNSSGGSGGTVGWKSGTTVWKWNAVYTDVIASGTNDITVPDVAGTMAVIQVNTTITLTAAGWSSNTQTVNVTGMTADGVVMVSPDPTDQSAYTSAGILCTAQAAGTLTFSCDTVPSGDIDVNVVML